MEMHLRNIILMLNTHQRPIKLMRPTILYASNVGRQSDNMYKKRIKEKKIEF